MIDSIFATKLDMTQAWSKQGKRLAVTRCRVQDNMVTDQKPNNIFEIGYGQKKLKNMSKPLRSKMQKSGFSMGAAKFQGFHQVQPTDSPETESDITDQIKVGDLIKVGQVLEVGDVVKVQGTSKGRGFTGVMKRHGFSGGPRTHGQSDRERAPGSIGAGTDPGRVWRGKKMPGHHGVETKTVSGLVVLYLNQDTNEIWLSGPIPAHYSSVVRITKTGQKKRVELDNQASGIQEQPQETQEEEKPVESTQKKKSASAALAKKEEQKSAKKVNKKEAKSIKKDK